MRILAGLLILLALLTGPALAVLPDEVLKDPVLEQRARTLSEELRCMVCQNQTIDDSDAPLARDLRILVRERLVAGDSDDEVLQFIVDRYGEFVLLKPRLSLRNAVLWGAPFALLMIGAIVAIVFLRRRRPEPAGPEPLSKQERAELARLLSERK
ncbi:MAG: cytochrome c-type biogenesis protein CcmH [Rhodobiaceae bacterium]|nr:cytochrome c-type biogenesis protein CcmH [Rhodobiaceae bacterium]MCC0054662.1 cytochrome c-type biogenesis protein CcmH [Rhodobiaceae bacterium]